MAKKEKFEKTTDERIVNIDTFIEESPKMKTSFIIGPSFRVWLKTKNFKGLEKKTNDEWEKVLKEFLNEKTN